MLISYRFLLFLPCFLALVGCAHGESPDTSVSAVGNHELKIISPTVLELSLVTTKEPAPARVTEWDFVSDTGELHLPQPSEFSVIADGQPIAVAEVGFRRRVTYAPLQPRDLRIGNYIYLRLASPIAEPQQVEVRMSANPQTKSTRLPTTAKALRSRTSRGGVVPAPTDSFVATSDPFRLSPAIHVSEVGYAPAFPKTAMIGYYLGSLGELDLPENTTFELIEIESQTNAYTGRLMLRADKGFPDGRPAYQRVFEANFTAFKTPGEYWLHVPGLGRSSRILITEGAPAAVARGYALGIYHQRCGTSNSLPFTRFVHDACHTRPAVVPTATLTRAEYFLNDSSSDYTNNPRHTAPQLSNFTASLYPYVRKRPVDISGGHHDAGDYSKYTINSAGFIHAMVFSADALPGVGELDNLGIPESGDGKSDLLQEAKWEADFLAKMQDDDGGFYFLAYPTERRYENDVLPDHGDAQIVWPKNTSATAAAVAALAQISSSPRFKQQFPEDAARYLQKARAGWQFLSRAIAKFGRDGAYQKLTHYGDEFMHDDELAWAACELFCATGEQEFHDQLLQTLNPDSPDQRRWGWWRLYESYGRAIRSYAFAARTGRLAREQLNPQLLQKCENEILACGDDQLRWAQDSAYGTSFPTDTKRMGGGGWYFSLDQAFDLAVAAVLDPTTTNRFHPPYLDGLVSNLDYEAGCNPVNVCYLTGLGIKPPQEIVDQFAVNDRRRLPPSGIPVGNIQVGFMWLDNYKEDLRAMSFPPDDSNTNCYPIYDRWSDSFNVQTEFVVVNQARALGAAAYLMAQTQIKTQAWRAISAEISIEPAPAGTAGYVAKLVVPNLPISEARMVWETPGQTPVAAPSLSVTNSRRLPDWIEAEASWPDGRRVFAITNVSERARFGGKTRP